MYKVYFYHPSSPSELERWLNLLWQDDGLELVAANVDFYIFRRNDSPVESKGIGENRDE